MSVDFNNTLKQFRGLNKGKRFAGATKCDDYYWGTLNRGKVQQNPIKVSSIFNPNDLKNNNVIVVVAESPHKDEYIFQKGTCISFKRPLSRCDKRINKYFTNNTNSWINNTLDYDIILVNAIQYQCSFGLSLRNNRVNTNQKTNIFNWTWQNEPAEKDLITRIDKIVNGKNEVIIFNSCGKVFKKYCNVTIYNKLKSSLSLKVYDEKHPSCW